MIPRVLLIALIVLWLPAFVTVVHGSDDQDLDVEDLVPVFTVRTDRSHARTYERFMLIVESQIVGLNETGNATLVPNQAYINVSLHDVTHDVVIRTIDRPLFLGRAEIPIVVEPIWTTTVVNISVWDFEHGLSGYAIVETSMSDEYLLYVFRTTWLAEFRRYGQEVRAAADTQIWVERILMLAFTATTVFTFFVLFLRADHRRARRLGFPSYYDRFASFIWPFSMLPDEFPTWIDPDQSWDPEPAKHWRSRRRAWAVARLKEEVESLQKEISDVLTGVLET